MAKKSTVELRKEINLKICERLSAGVSSNEVWNAVWADMTFNQKKECKRKKTE